MAMAGSTSVASENTTQRQIWLALGAMCRLFRVNTGKAWMSNLGPKGVKQLGDGSVLILAARPIALGFGLPNGDPLVGASDLDGWTTVIVSQEMVGRPIAVKTAIETKRTNGGRATEGQINYTEQVKKAGGIAGIANSPEAAKQIILDWLAQNRAKLL